VAAARIGALGKDGKTHRHQLTYIRTTKEEQMPYGSWVNDLPTGFGDSVSIKFDKPGSYHHVSTLHSKDMDGTVVVT